MLLNDLYSVISSEIKESSVVYRVALNPECKVYEGHFPNEPITPGVCTIQIIKECLDSFLGKETILTEIKQCRLTHLITPQQYPELEVKIDVKDQTENSVSFYSTIGLADNIFLEIKAQAQWQEK